jgi:parallel beta-helix repeat protein
VTLTKIAVATWDGKPDGSGNSPNANWATAANWVGDTVPAAGAVLVFPDTASQKTSVNNLANNTTFSHVIITGEGFTLSGNPIQLSGGLESHNQGNFFNLDVRQTQATSILNRADLVFQGNGSALFTVGGKYDLNGFDLNIFNNANSSDVRIDGVISDSGNNAGNVTSTGQGKTTFTAANTYRGVTKVPVGILSITHSQALGTGDGTAATGTELGDWATLDLKNNIQVVNEFLATSIADLNGSMAIQSEGNNRWSGKLKPSSSFHIYSASDGILQFDQDNELNPGSMLFVNGGGKTILGGSTYLFNSVSVSGSGTVLEVNGTINSAININDGASLTGSGTLGEVTVLNGASISPGSSFGTLTVSKLNLNPNSTLNIDIGGINQGNNYDWLQVTGVAALNGKLVVTTQGATIQREDLYQFLTYASATGDFSEKQIPTVNGQAIGLLSKTSTAYELSGRFLIVTNVNDSGEGSLRDAITRANSFQGQDDVFFALPSGSNQVIHLTTSLPEISDSIRMDARVELAGKLLPGIALNGNAINGNSVGLLLSGSNSLIAGFAIGGFYHALQLTGDNNDVFGNFIGLDLTENPLANTHGIVISGKNNRVGSGTDGEGNVISGNDKIGDSAGVLITGTNATGNRVQGNRIGTNKAGSAAVKNSQGVAIKDNATQNIVGTDGDGTADSTERNLISGNGWGVNIEHGGTQNNRIAGNWIGLDNDGTGAIPNTLGGVVVSGSNNLIGTNGDGNSDQLERNVISGNAEAGIRISFGTGTRIAGNYIGITAAGTAKLGNNTGIAVTGATGAIIGTNSDTLGDSAEGNVISGNSLRGILITGSGSDGAIIAGNFIGTDPSGTVGLGNSGNGIAIIGANQVRIGTDGSDDAFNALERNVVSNNGQAGIEITGGTNISIAGNIIGLKSDGTTPLGNALEGILIGGGSGVVIGTDGNNVRDTDERNIVSGNSYAGISIYGPSSNIVVAGNYIGTDSQGTVARGNGTKGVEISGTSTNIRIGSLNDGVNEANERNVISGNNRAGISTLVNGTVISGNYLGTDVSGTADLGNKENGIFVLGAVNTTIRGNIISGNDLTGIDVASSNSTIIQGNTIGLNAAGTAKIANTGRGIDVRGGTGNVIGTDGNGTNDSNEGNVISGNSESGIRVYDNANTTRIAGNRIGTDSAGSTAIANSADGIRIETSQSTLVGTNGDGTSDTLERNIISGNTGNGITGDSAGVKSLVIAGNYIGTSLNGLARTANEGSGIALASVSNAVIGGTLAVQGNLISGNNGDSGIHLNSSPQSVIKNNIIGLNATGNNAIGHPNYGIRNHFSDNTEISNNNISGNGIGMLLRSSTDVTIAGNFIGLSPDGFNSIPNTYSGISAQYCHRLVIGTRGLDASTSNGNYIAGNGYHQIRLDLCTQNVIAGNSIGVGVNGQAVIGGITEGSIKPHGILAVSSTDLRIGTDGSADGFNATESNVIGGNAKSGIHLAGTVAAPDLRTIIAGNYIGVTTTGEKRANNIGIWLSENNKSTLIGTNDDGNYDALESNVVSGNTGNGIELSTASDIVIAGNIIGLKPDGQTVQGNGQDGISIGSSTSIRVGTDGDNVSDSIEKNVVSGNAQAGINIWGSSSNVVVAGNMVGTNSNGSVVRSNSQTGIAVTGTSQNIRIGALADGVNEANERNIVSGNHTGIFSGAKDVTISGNYVGTDATGQIDLGNSFWGIRFEGANNNLVRNNVISGNNRHGIETSISTSTKIQGNIIGLTATGNAALGNSERGIDVRGDNGTIIGTDGDGTDDATEGNIISANGWYGIVVTASSSNTRIAGNKIGTNAEGTLAMGNASQGIFISESTGTIIGTNGDGQSDNLEGNLISGNQVQGIEADSANVKSLTIAGNLIGTTANGLGRLPNIGNGIKFTNVANAVIGGPLPAQRNIISGNNAAGLLLYGSELNTISNNVFGLDKNANEVIKNNTYGIQVEVYASNNIINNNVVSGNNQGILIKSSGYNTMTGNIVGLAGDGFTARPNTVYGIGLVGGSCDFNRIGTNGDGSNDAAERNVIAGNGQYNLYLDFAFDTTIAGNYIGLSSDGKNTYANSATIAGVYLNNTTNTRIGTNSSNDQFNEAERNYIAGSAGAGISITGSDPNNPYRNNDTVIAGNIIGLSIDGAVASNLGRGISVTGNSINTRIGSDFNGSYDSLERNTISGNQDDGIYLSGSGVKDTKIRGNFIGTSIDGTAARGNKSRGIYVEQAPAVFISGNVVSGNESYGITVSNANGTQIVGNMIGTTGDGNAPVPNTRDGIYILNGADQTTIGGTTQAARNIIAYGASSGIVFSGTGSQGSTVLGNYIGTNASGSADAGNTKFGILVENSPSITVGGTAAGSYNVISGNNAGGVAFVGGLTTSGKVEGNYIGTDATVSNAIGNSSFGIFVGDSSLLGLPDTGSAKNVTIGGSAVASRNIISGNAGPGVWLAGATSTGNIVSGNYIGTNLAGNAAIPNDLGILISNRANSNIIGGTTSGTRNLISGNSGIGVRVIDSESINNTIRGNWIGINAAGNQALSNGSYGIAVGLGASATSILENTVSGNLLGGIFLGSSTSANTLKGNLIGTDPAVTKAIGNGSVEIAAFGISISGSNGNTIGGEAAADRNIIAGNYGNGLEITGNSSNNIVIGNSFGTNTSGTATLPNTANGIFMEGNNVNNNQIGGNNAAQGNLLFFNLLAGIRLVGTTSGTAAGNSFNFNVFNGNGSLAIDTGETGPTKNDSQDVDGVPNAPVIATAYITAAGKLIIEGYSRPGKTIQFYTTSQFSNGRGQGNKRLYSLVEGSANDLNPGTSSYDYPDVGSDAVANLFSFEVNLGATPAVSVGDLITAVAVGSTSEFGNIVVVSEEGSNQAPVVSLAEQSVTVKTGQAMTLAGSFIDLDSTNWSATVNYGDGSQTENLELSPQRTFTLNHVFRRATATNTPRQVLVTVTDDSGMQGTAIVNVTVLNEAPVITTSTLVFEKTVNEGGVMTLSGAFTDTGTEETHTVVIQWGDGTTSSLPIAAGVSTFQTTHVYADDNPTRTSKDTYNFEVTVSDEGGLSHSVSDLTITEVSNVRPYDFSIDTSALSNNGNGVPTVAEGTLFTLTGVFKDPGLKDSHEVIVNWGDGTPLEKISLPSVSNQTLTRTFNLSHIYANNPLAPLTNYEVSFELVDDDEPTTPRLLTQLIAVTNVVPTLNTLSLANASIDENGIASLSINFSDPGINDTHQVIIDWGDGSEPESITTLAGTRSLTGITHLYRDNNTGGAPYNIVVKIADNDMPANTFASSSISLNVANKAPTFNEAVQLYVKDAAGQWTAVSAGTAINEGDQVRITGSFSDVSELDTHTVMIQWAAGEITEANVNAKLRTFEAIYTYRDDYAPGTAFDVETITITLTDDDGGSASTTSSVRVNNVAPSGLFVPKSNSTTSLIQLTASIVDPGEEVFTYSWKAAKVLSPTLDQIIEQGTAKDFSVTTSLYTGYTIKVTMYVADDDLGTYTYVSTLLAGTDSDDNLSINSSNFAAGTSNLTIVSFAGSDTLNATSLDSSKNVVLDGGDGVDYLFGGSGNDTFILRSGNDQANYSALSNTGVGDEGGGFLVIPNEGGNDSYILVPNSTLTIVDRSGENSLDFNRASFGIEYDLSRLNSLQFDTQEVASGGHFIKAMGEFDGLIGSNFGDRLTGAAGASVFGGGGADTLIAVSGSSAIEPSQFFGGADADTFVITGSQLNYIDFSGDSGADIFTISAGTLGGIDFSGGADADIFNITGGTLSGIDFGGGADADIFNLTGNITFNTVDFSGDSGMDIFNIGGTVTGTIDFGGGADADTFNLLNTGNVGSIDFSGDSGADVFVIAGTVTGGIDFSGGADNDIFQLTGTVSGSIDLQGDSGADDFTISGTVLGGVDFGGGADADYLLIDGSIQGTLPPVGGVTGPSLRFQGDIGADELEIRGTISGGIDFGGGADADIFTISGQVTGTIDFSGGADADIFTLNSGGQTGGIDFSGDSGADELIIRGTVTGGIDFGGGADGDTLLITGSITGTLPGSGGTAGPAISFTGDSGADVLEIRSTISGGIDFGGGADADTLLIVGTVNNGIDFAGDSGADIFELRGTANGAIDFSGGADADIFVLNGTARASAIDFSGGADADIFLINTNATSGGIDFSGDSGSDIFEIRGTVSGSIDFGGGADADLFTITSTGTTGGINFEGDSGADEFNMRGTVTGSIDFGGGADADLFTITGTASGGINFEGDSGDDRLLNQGNTLNITFLGGEGKDIFRNDTSNLTNLTFYGFESPSRLSMGDAANDGNDLFANYGSGIGQINYIGNNGADVLYSVGNNIGSINFTGDSGADVFIIEGTTIGTIDFSGGADADSFSISGSQIGSIDFAGDSSTTDNGDDIFVNTASGQTDSSGKPIGTLFFSGLGGNDILRNDGEDWSEIIFVAGNGSNGLQNNADDIALIAYEGGDDTDTFENNGHNVSNLVFLGNSGNDVFINDGNNASHMIYFGGQGDDQFLNTGTNADGVQFVDESGSNRLVNTGSNAKNFYFQGGNSADTLLNKGADADTFLLYGNAGVDRFLNDTTATEANNIQLLDNGAIASILWPFISSPPFTLPSIPTPVSDDTGDIFINKGASSSNIRFEGGVGNDFFQNQAAGVTAVTYLGGAGNDNGLNTSEGSSLTNFTFQGGAGNDAFQNDGTTANNLIFHGEADNDSFYQNGTYAGTIEFFAGDGTNVFVNWGSNATTLRMTGGVGADRFQNNADNITTIDFTTGGGINALQNNGDNISTISMTGGSDADTLINIGNYVTFIDFTGQAGPDSLINSGNVLGGTAVAGTANTGINFTGGAGQDALRTQGVGLTTLNFIGGGDGDSLIYNTVSGGTINYDAGTENDGFIFRGNATSIDVNLGAGNDRVAYLGEVTTGDGTSPNVLITGGDGDDNYEFSRYPKGYLQLTELYGGATDNSRDSLSFSFYLNGGITLDLSSTTKQQLGADSQFWIQFPSNSVMGIENVTGTGFDDTLLGNDRPNTLSGAAYATNKPTNPVAQNRATQWVYLDFTSQTNLTADENEYVYTAEDKLAVIQGLRKAYYGTKSDGTIREFSDPDRWFNVRFASSLSDIPSDVTEYVTIRFNETPPNGYAGGLASEIDYGNLNMSGVAVVQIHGLLGGTALPPVLSVDGSGISGDFLNPSGDGALTFLDKNPENTVANFIALSVKVSAHELGHLLGLRHYDAFGPIGSGVHSPPGSASFNPDYSGVSEAYETFQHLISSPASVGSDRNNDIGNLFFGEREAIKLAFVMSDTNVTRTAESPFTKSTLQTAQPLAWSTITVPNTLSLGVNANQNLYAETLSLTGKIELASDGKSEKDFYSFAGKAGDMLSFEVGSRALRRYTNPGDLSNLSPSSSTHNTDSYIDSTIRIYDSLGNLIPYYTTTAYNDDEFESTDSILLDLVLPSDDTYRIEVGTFTDTDIGNYELFAYRFKRENKTDGTNTLLGRGGADSLNGSPTDNYNIYFPTGALPSNAQSTETTTYTANIPFVDAGGYSWQALVEYGDGSSETITGITPSTGISLSHAYGQNGAYTLKITLSNDDNRSVVGQFTVTVANVAPTASIDVTGKLEGSATIVTMTGSDTAADIAAGLRYKISTSQSSRDAATYSSSSSSNSASIVFADNGTYTVYMRVIDADGGYTDYDRQVTVDNVAPTVVVKSVSTPRNVGKPITITAEGTDPANQNDVLTYYFEVTRSGSIVSSGSGSAATHAFTPGAAGSYLVSVYATDEDGGTSTTASSSFDVTLEEILLEVTPPQDGYYGVAGQLRNFEFSASSLNSTSYSFVVDWKDGSALESFQTTAANQKITIGHRFLNRGAFRPTVTVTDSQQRTKSLTMNELTILAYETQGSVLAIGASDGGSENDAIIVEAQTTANKFMVIVNNNFLSNLPLDATGTVLIYGGAGTDSLSMRGTFGADQFRVTTTDIVLNTQWPIRGDSIESRELLAQGGNDQITVAEFTTITLNGGTGTDTLIGPDLNVNWDVRESGGGILLGIGNFTGFENLTGGNAMDRFIIRSTGQVPGTLDGGAGENVLDYSIATSAIVVDFSSSPRKASLVSNITDSFSLLIGGSTNDSLIGSPTRPMLIVGGSGNDTITGGSAYDILIGGLGIDTMRGNAGQDVLIGGRITFDTDLNALLSIFREWTRQDNNYANRFSDRVNNLSGATSGGLNAPYFLTTTGSRTVLDDRAADILFGNENADWFLSLSTEIRDFNVSEDRRNF